MRSFTGRRNDATCRRNQMIAAQRHHSITSHRCHHLAIFYRLNHSNHSTRCRAFYRHLCCHFCRPSCRPSYPTFWCTGCLAARVLSCTSCRTSQLRRDCIRSASDSTCHTLQYIAIVHDTCRDCISASTETMAQKWLASRHKYRLWFVSISQIIESIVGAQTGTKLKQNKYLFRFYFIH